MPWSAEDATRFQSKATTDKLKSLWASTANSVLAECLKDSGKQKDCEGKAIRIANSQVNKMMQEGAMENEWTMADVAKTAIEVGLAVARETQEIANDDATKKLSLLQSKMNELCEARVPVASIAEIEIDGAHLTFSDLVEFYQEHRADDTPSGDEEPPSEEMTALEALAVVEAYITARAVSQESSTECKDDVLEFIEDMGAPAYEEPVIEYDTEEVSRVDIDVSAHALQIAEDVGEASRDAPLKLDVVLIEPGFGNKKMNRYYAREMLRQEAPKFQGIKMYTTNHKAGEKNVKDSEVAVILECPVGFTPKGGPIGRVGIFDSEFARNTRNRAELGALNTLEASILGWANMRKGKVNGKRAMIVQEFTDLESVDWVTNAGAGGRALQIVESADGGNDMTEEIVEEEVVAEDEIVVEEVVETETTEEPQEDVVEVEGDVQEARLEESAVAETVDKTSLPEAFKNALKVQEYADEDALTTAVEKAIADYKDATGSGKPFGQGQKKKAVKEIAESDPMERRSKRYHSILRESGLE